jgi:septal ring factor EnvC (AmiA/AmiB activator)
MMSQLLLLYLIVFVLVVFIYTWRQKMDERLALLEAALTRIGQEVNETAQEVERLKDLIGDNSEAQAAIDAAIVRLHNAADALNALQPAPAPEPPVEPVAAKTK